MRLAAVVPQAYRPGHRLPVYAVRWNGLHPRTFLSAGADWRVKLWDSLLSKVRTGWLATHTALQKHRRSTRMGLLGCCGQGVMLNQSASARIHTSCPACPRSCSRC